MQKPAAKERFLEELPNLLDSMPKGIQTGELLAKLKTVGKMIEGFGSRGYSAITVVFCLQLKMVKL